MQKSITLPNFEKSILNITAGNKCLQSYNSSILQILQDQTIDLVEQAAYNNDVLPF
jgi:hypothetical protein